MINFIFTKKIVSSGLCLTGMALGCFAQKTDKKPNIIYVFSDEQSIYELSGSLGGDPIIQTPNLDKLASQGIQFTRCVSNNSISVPHRAMLMTGQYSQNNGMLYNSDYSFPENKIGLQPDRPLFPVELRKQGYKMGYVGKWHLYPETNENKVVPEEFRYGFTDYWRKSSNYKDRYNTGYYDNKGVFHKLDGYAPTAQMDQLMEFVKMYKNEPFCAVLSWHPPHPPYRQGPQKWVDYYKSKLINYRKNVPDDLKTAKLKEDFTGAYSHVSALDEEMGRLMNLLEELNIDENTILIYSSDHGDLLQSQGWIGKVAPWNESILVPFIIRWPSNIKGGQKVDIPFSTVHIAPTLLGFAGVKVPDKMDGTDYSKFMQGKKSTAPKSAFIMGIAPPDVYQRDSTLRQQRLKFVYDWRGVYTGKYTYALNKENGKIVSGWLYDNENDPFQLNNLIEDEKYMAIAKKLKKDLYKYLVSVNETEWLGNE